MAGWYGPRPACFEISKSIFERRQNVSLLASLSHFNNQFSSLELGAGGGLVGLGVAIGCEVDQAIYITDQENMLELMEKNVILNGLESRVIPLVLNWYAS